MCVCVCVCVCACVRVCLFVCDEIRMYIVALDQQKNVFQ